MSEQKSAPVYKQADIPLTSTSTSKASAQAEKKPVSPNSKTENPKKPAQEIGGPEGPEPTRYGDWERNGRCVDF